VVPGALLAAMANGLGSMDVPLARTVALVGMTWRFERPVRPGDTISCCWRLNRKRGVEEPAWGLCGFAVEVKNQRDEVVATADMVRLIERRPVAGTEVVPAQSGPAEGEAARSGRRRRRRRSGTGDGPAQEPLVAAEVLAAEPSAVEQPFVESLPAVEAVLAGGAATVAAPALDGGPDAAASAAGGEAGATSAAATATPEQGDGQSGPVRRRRRRGGRGRGGREPAGAEAPTSGAVTAADATAPLRADQSAAQPGPFGAPAASSTGQAPAAQPAPTPFSQQPGALPAAAATATAPAPAVSAPLPTAPTPFSQEPAELDPNRFAPLNAPPAAEERREEVAAAHTSAPAPRPSRRGGRRTAEGTTANARVPSPAVDSERPAGAASVAEPAAAVRSGRRTRAPATALTDAAQPAAAAPEAAAPAAEPNGPEASPQRTAVPRAGRVRQSGRSRLG